MEFSILSMARLPLHSYTQHGVSLIEKQYRLPNFEFLQIFAVTVKKSLDVFLAIAYPTTLYLYQHRRAYATTGLSCKLMNSLGFTSAGLRRRKCSRIPTSYLLCEDGTALH